MTAEWFERLIENRYIEAILLADNKGRVLRSSRPLRSDDELIASMFQSVEVLAQALSKELQCGAAQMVQISAQNGHLLMFPLINSTYYLVAIVGRAAPLLLLMIELERIISDLTAGDIAVFEDDLPTYREDDSEMLDAAELIRAVQEWLGKRTPGQN